jgi:hypothetical protein
MWCTHAAASISAWKYVINVPCPASARHFGKRASSMNRSAASGQLYQPVTDRLPVTFTFGLDGGPLRTPLGGDVDLHTRAHRAACDHCVDPPERHRSAKRTVLSSKIGRTFCL